jgi:hypothetical protein
MRFSQLDSAKLVEKCRYGVAQYATAFSLTKRTHTVTEFVACFCRNPVGCCEMHVLMTVETKTNKQLIPAISMTMGVGLAMAQIPASDRTVPNCH